LLQSIYGFITVLLNILTPIDKDGRAH
jgi:hypothetical protein